jgi:uncharacterized membrane protein required for colicin V production
VKILKSIIGFFVGIILTPLFLFFLFLRKFFEKIEEYSFFIHMKIEDCILKKLTKFLGELSDWIRK